MSSSLIPYVRAGFPVIYLHCLEEFRAELACHEIASYYNLTGEQFQVWSCSEGLHPVDKVTDWISDKQAKQTMLAANALGKIYSEAKNVVVDKNMDVKRKLFIFRDLHLHFNNPVVLRLLRDISRCFKSVKHSLILVSPVRKIPPEIERDLHLVEYSLPRQEQLKTQWKEEIYNQQPDSFSDLKEDDHDKIGEAAVGLTLMEASNAFAKAAIVRSTLLKELKEAKTDDQEAVPTIAELVMKEKAKTIKKSGILEFWDIKQLSRDIGGLDVLKAWLNRRRLCYSKEAAAFGVDKPKGIVLVGLPGCGKSLSAKAAATEMQVPLVRFDIAKVFQGLVGASEDNMRNALSTIDAIGDSVVWLDEVEKVLGGVGQSSGDSGVSQRVFGTLLTWMQERSGSSFIIATVNNIEGLPPELTRKGRFDEIFFVDQPDDAAREEILEIHIRKKGRDPEVLKKKDPTGWKELVSSTKGFSGSEIEEAVKSALLSAYNQKIESGKDVDLDVLHIMHAVQNTTPLSKSQADNLKKMAEWAKTHAVPASTVKKTVARNYARILDL